MRDGITDLSAVASVAILQALEALVELLDLDDEVGDGVEEPVEEERGGDEKSVALTLHDGFLVAEVFGGGAGFTLAAGTRLVLPVNVHEEEEAEGDDREERLQQVAGDRDQTLAEGVEAGDREENDHYGLCGGGVAQHNPL